MIAIDNIGLSYGNKTLFHGITWMIPPKSRLGLVGDNGTGKTTLLKAIMANVVLDSGAITVTQKENGIGYLPQDLVELEPINIIEYLEKKSGLLQIRNSLEDYTESLSYCPPEEKEYKDLLKKYEESLELFNAKDGYSFEPTAKRILTGLGFKERDFLKNCSEFSGGLKMRILFAAILLSKPDILLLDEPTNHLDTESMEWVENYLKDYYGTIIAISHDRVFLDKIVNQIGELSNGKLTIYHGNYSYYIEEKNKKIAILLQEKKSQDREIKRIQTFIDRFRYKASKAKQVQSRIKMLEKIDLIEIEKESKKAYIRFPECRRSGYEVLNVENLSKTYGELLVFDDVSFTVHRGDRISLVGVNGAGKSTLTRIISKREKPTTGKIKYGVNVKPAFFSQETADNLDYNKSVFEEIDSVNSKCTELELRRLLGAFLFTGSDIYKKIGVLSGGEKSRLALLKILLKDANLLILDEPTNHLDIKTKEIFQDALLNYTGTILIVSHDRYFLDSLVNRVIEIRNGRCYQYSGNYSYFIKKRARDEAKKTRIITSEIKRSKDKKITKGYKSKDQKRKEAEERNRISKLKRELRDKIKGTEEQINNLERLKEENIYLLSILDVEGEPKKAKTLSRKTSLIDKKLEGLYSAWDEFINKLSEIEIQ